jgi:hypothetical protein
MDLGARTFRDREAGAAGLLGVAVLGLLVVTGLAGSVLVSTMHARAVPGPQIQEGRLLAFSCPADVIAGAPEGQVRSCRRLEVVNTGQGEGTAMCVLINDTRGATARFADNQSFHHALDLAPGQTGNLLVTVDGTPAKHDAMEASCGIPPQAD